MESISVYLNNAWGIVFIVFKPLYRSGPHYSSWVVVPKVYNMYISYYVIWRMIKEMQSIELQIPDCRLYSSFKWTCFTVWKIPSLYIPGAVLLNLPSSPYLSGASYEYCLFSVLWLYMHLIVISTCWLPVTTPSITCIHVHEHVFTLCTYTIDIL